MCPPKSKVKDPPPIPDPAPPVEETATAIKRDEGDKLKQAKGSTATSKRKAATDLRVDLSIPGTQGSGLQI